MMDRFNQLAPREQLMVAIVAALLLLAIVWVFIWSPLHRSTTELDQAVAEKSRLVIDLRRASGLRRATGSAPAQSQTMMLLVTQTAQGAGLPAFTRHQPDGSDAYIVSFQNAPFHTLVEWLADLEQSHGVNVTSASFSGTRDAGLVDGQVFLDRS